MYKHYNFFNINKITYALQLYIIDKKLFKVLKYMKKYIKNFLYITKKILYK